MLTAVCYFSTRASTQLKYSVCYVLKLRKSEKLILSNWPFRVIVILTNNWKTGFLTFSPFMICWKGNIVFVKQYGAIDQCIFDKFTCNVPPLSLCIIVDCYQHNEKSQQFSRWIKKVNVPVLGRIINHILSSRPLVVELNLNGIHLLPQL